MSHVSFDTLKARKYRCVSFCLVGFIAPDCVFHFFVLIIASFIFDHFLSSGLSLLHIYLVFFSNEAICFCFAVGVEFNLGTSSYCFCGLLRFKRFRDIKTIQGEPFIYDQTTRWILYVKCSKKIWCDHLCKYLTFRMNMK